MRTALLTTGKTELIGLPCALHAAFPAHDFVAHGVTPGRPFRGFTSSVLPPPDEGLPTNVDTLVARVTLVREAYDDLRWNERRGIPAGPPQDLQAVLTALLRAVDAPDDQVAEAISSQLVELGGARLRRDQWQESLASQLASNELVFQIAAALEKPRALDDLPGLVGQKVGRPVPEAEILAWLALGAATGRGGHDPLLRPVVHSFVRGVGGAVVTFSNPNAAARLWLAGEDAKETCGLPGSPGRPARRRRRRGRDRRRL